MHVSRCKIQDTLKVPVLHVALCILTLALIGCNTRPVGYDQLSNRVSGASDTTLLPDSTASYMRYVPLGGSSLLYLGRDASYQSRIVMLFSIPDTMNLDSITSCQLVLHPVDTLARMNFICRPCSLAWLESGVSWQMADSSDHWLNPGGSFLPDTLASGTITGDSAMIDMKYAGLDSARRATIRTCGVILFPEDTGIVAIHAGVSTTSATSPRLRITYTSNGKQTQRIVNDVGDASLIDTIATQSEPGDLLVGSGVAYRTWLTFNIDSIPPQATIASAELKFRPMTLYRRTDTIILGASRLTQSFGQWGAGARYESVPSAASSYIVPADSDSTVTIDIRSMVQIWTSHSDTLHNFGLVLTAAPEWSALFRFQIPDRGADAPHLDIKYVLPPEDRFK
ncbi:MAG TPA: DNRLRE domain-containing protein [bacterium]|nr:DNRLRE domain-containing protein [bacterium]